MNKITIREIPSHNIVITADDTGMVWVNDRAASNPVTVAGASFVWGGVADGLPAHTKISLTAENIKAINAHSAAHVATLKEMARKAAAFDKTINEGGEGFNPYR